MSFNFNKIQASVSQTSFGPTYVTQTMKDCGAKSYSTLFPY